MTELDYAVDSLEMSEDERVALLNATKDLRSKASYVYDIYNFWDNAPEFKEFDNMHSYMLKKSKASPSSFSTTLKYARGSYNTVADSIKEGRLVSPLTTAIESQPEEYVTYEPISMAFHEEDHRDTRDKCVEMYKSLHGGGFYTRMSEHSAEDVLIAGNSLGIIAEEYHDIVESFGYSGYLPDGGRKRSRQTRSERIKIKVCKAGMILCGAAAIGYDVCQNTGGESVFSGAGLIFSSGLA